MSQDYEQLIREAAKAVCAKLQVSDHIVSEVLVEELLPKLKASGTCPHVVASGESRYCRLAENEAQRLRALEGCIQGAEKIGLHVIPPALSRGHGWAALYRVDKGDGPEWVAREFPTFGNLILSLPTN